MILEKQDSNFSKLLLSSLICLIILSCNHHEVRLEDKDPSLQKSYEKLSFFFNGFPGIKFSRSTSSILLLTENGCYTCNKEFSGLLEKYINLPKSILVITASGTRLDLSSFISDSSKNVVVDYMCEFGKLSITDKSAAIFLSNGEIDTIIYIEAYHLKRELQQIDSLQNKLN